MASTPTISTDPVEGAPDPTITPPTENPAVVGAPPTMPTEAQIEEAKRILAVASQDERSQRIAPLISMVNSSSFSDILQAIEDAYPYFAGDMKVGPHLQAMKAGMSNLRTDLASY